jgi:hypothetical protein
VTRTASVVACIAGLVAGGPAGAPGKGTCPPETAWDGIACAHARATCGAWDGTSCEPEAVEPRKEHALRENFSRIDADARAICSEEAAEVYTGSAGDVLKAADAAMARAVAIDSRLEELRDRADSPDWSVATLSRAGSLYDCIWSSFAGATPSLFTPQQQAKLNQLQALQQSSPISALQQALDDTAKQVQEKWLESRDKYIDWITRKMVVRYATAALLARRYATEGFSLTRACERLPFVATTLGPDRMAGILATVPDPTDPMNLPESHRHVLYFDGAFGR